MLEKRLPKSLSVGAPKTESAKLLESEADRRRAPRHALKTRVALKTEKAIFFMESIDVSTSGIRLQSEIPIEVGTQCRLVPFFEDVAHLFEARGTVVRVADAPSARPHESKPSELGIHFDPLSQTELEALLGILRRADAAPMRVAQS